MNTIKIPLRNNKSMIFESYANTNSCSSKAACVNLEDILNSDEIVSKTPSDFAMQLGGSEYQTYVIKIFKWRIRMFIYKK